LKEEEENYLSVDDFLYARCAVVAEGKKYYEKVLNMPSEMPETITFESLLYIDKEAFKIKIGKEFNYMRNQKYETYSNKEGWK
jgi:hypothetical protein